MLIEKSLALAAARPSFPAIPIPTQALIIIGTSLAPSPIDNVVLFGWLSLTNKTISAFYLGLTRHAKTTSTLSVILRSLYFPSFIFSIRGILSPFKIRAYLISSSSRNLCSARLNCISRIYS
jgi:hypothetical protein